MSKTKYKKAKELSGELLSIPIGITIGMYVIPKLLPHHNRDLYNNDEWKHMLIFFVVAVLINALFILIQKFISKHIKDLI